MDKQYNDIEEWLEEENIKEQNLLEDCETVAKERCKQFEYDNEYKIYKQGRNI